MAMEEPRAWVVGEEPDRDVIACVTDVHDVADDGIHKVVRRVSGAADYVEIVSVQMNRVLLEVLPFNSIMFKAISRPHTGPSVAPPGMVSSTLLLASRL